MDITGFGIVAVLLIITGAGLFLWSTRPLKQKGETTRNSVLQTWQWKQAAILGSGPILALLLSWQLWTLEPGHWCAVATEDGFLAGDRLRKLEVCKEILLELLNLKDHAIIGMLAILGGIIGMLTVSEYKTRLKVDGPMGSSVEIGPHQKQG